MFPEDWLVINRMGKDTGPSEKESKLKKVEYESMESEWNKNTEKIPRDTFKIF